MDRDLVFYPSQNLTLIIMYKVTAKDLIGRLKGFPIEVVQKMLEKQVEQHQLENVKVFQECAGRSALNGGFDWEDTKEGTLFWSKVISNKDFKLFFEKYPKSTTSNKGIILNKKAKIKLNFQL